MSGRIIATQTLWKVGDEIEIKQDGKVIILKIVELYDE